MPKQANKAPRDVPETSAGDKPRGRLEKSLKWVGGITAILSLIFGLSQLAHLVSDARERQRLVAELVAVGKAQQDARNYPAAWTSFEQALKRAEEGATIAKLIGQLGEERRHLREAQEDLAMAWLENIRISKDQKFSDIVDSVLPTLVRGAAAAGGTRKADLLAHVGWAYFLKARDGNGDLNPERQYRAALQIDPSNPYAHAYLGHWTMWKRDKLEGATQHFSAALASRRVPDYVRGIQLAALKNLGSEADGEFLRVVNDMRKNNEKIDAATRRDVYAIYYFDVWGHKDIQRLTAAVPATEQIALVRALFDAADYSSHIPPEAYLAILQEAAGQRDEALKTWLAVRSRLPADASDTVVTRADAAIRRLSALSLIHI